MQLTPVSILFLGLALAAAASPAPALDARDDIVSELPSLFLPFSSPPCNTTDYLPSVFCADTLRTKLRPRDSPRHLPGLLLGQWRKDLRKETDVSQGVCVQCGGEWVYFQYISG